MGILSIVIMVVLAVGGVVTAGVRVLIDMRRRQALRPAGGETGTYDEAFPQRSCSARAQW